MILTADLILMEEGTPMPGGAIRVEGDRIVEVGRYKKMIRRPAEPLVELEGCVISPGFINAHCHLDYTDFKGVIPPQASFTEWIKKINALKHDRTTQDYCSGIARGYELLLASGTTTVVNIAAIPEVFPYLATPPLRVWWFLELIDLRSRLQLEEAMIGVLYLLERSPSWIGGIGLSPHAPYTASAELFRHVQRCCESMNLLATTHIAESREEQEMFLYGKGKLYEFLEKLGRDVSDCAQGSSFSHLYEMGAIDSRWLIAHLNYLQEYDYGLLSRSGASVVHCPKCHAYFGHQRFSLERLQEQGVNICLGTDSLASNNTLDLRAEIRMARHHYPDLSSRDWWKMITLRPARALRQEGLLGQIRVGAKADLVAFALSGQSDVFSELIDSRQAPVFLMIDGKTVALPA